MSQQMMFHRNMLASGSTSMAVGLHGERLVADALEKRGYEVMTPRPGEHRGDLRAIDPATGEITTIEVKTARAAHRHRKQGNTYLEYRFTLRKTGHTSHLHSDVVVLLCALRSGDVVPFVIPTGDIRDLKNISIYHHPLDYTGRFACYRQRMTELTLEV